MRRSSVFTSLNGCVDERPSIFSLRAIPHLLSLLCPVPSHCVVSVCTSRSRTTSTPSFVPCRQLVALFIHLFVLVSLLPTLLDELSIYDVLSLSLLRQCSRCGCHSVRGKRERSENVHCVVSFVDSVSSRSSPAASISLRQFVVVAIVVYSLSTLPLSLGTCFVRSRLRSTLRETSVSLLFFFLPLCMLSRPFFRQARTFATTPGMSQVIKLDITSDGSFLASLSSTPHALTSFGSDLSLLSCWLQPSPTGNQGAALRGR
jgi:hypothetical protein